jgi:hypothetical protein
MLVAIAAIAFALCFSSMVPIAASSPTLALYGSPAPAFGGPQIRDEEIWEEEGWDERNGKAKRKNLKKPKNPIRPSRSIATSTARRRTLSPQAATTPPFVSPSVQGRRSDERQGRVLAEGRPRQLPARALRRHISTQGAIQGIERLSARAMAKVRAARIFVVRLETPGLPQHCKPYSTGRLAAKREAGDRAIWSEPTLGTENAR